MAMRRRKKLRTDPAKVRAWEQRSARPYLNEAPRTRSRNGKSPRNDAEWRKEVLAVRGAVCRACGDWRVEADHVVERSQGGPSVVENGMPLCGVWSRLSPWPNGCHKAKTEGRMKIDPAWLDPDQIGWLEENGHVWWDRHGEPCGRLCKGFLPMRRVDTAGA